MWACTSVNVRPCPARHRRAPSRSTTSSESGTRPPGRASSRSRSTARCARAGGRRRSTGAARAGTGTRARARGRASHARSTRPVRVDRDARQQLAIGLDHGRRCPESGAALARRSGAAAPRARRSGGRPPGALRTRVGILGHAAHVLVVGVHPQLAAGALDDRRGLSVVVGVGVRADHQAPCSSRRSHIASARSRLRERVGLVHAGVEQHEPVARRHRPGVAMGDARPGQRQAQAKDARAARARPVRARAGGPSPRRCSPRPRARRLDYASPSSGDKGDGMAERRQATSRRPPRCRRQPPTCSRWPHAQARISRSAAESVARRYFEAIDARDLDARRGAVGAGRPRERARPGRRDRAGRRARFIGELLDAIPDLRFEVISRPPRASAARCNGGSGHVRRPRHVQRSRAHRQPDRRSKASTC